MEVWYQSKFGKIQEVTVVRSTEKFVVLPNGRREAIDTDWCWYRRDREQAKAAMVAAYQAEVESALQTLRRKQAKVVEAQRA